MRGRSLEGGALPRCNAGHVRGGGEGLAAHDPPKSIARATLLK
jgi:hypothetical protein